MIYMYIVNKVIKKKKWIYYEIFGVPIGFSISAILIRKNKKK